MNVSDEEYLIYLESAIAKNAGDDPHATLTATLGRIAQQSGRGTSRFPRRLARVRYGEKLSAAEATGSLSLLALIARAERAKADAQKNDQPEPYPTLLVDALEKVIASKGEPEPQVLDAFEKAVEQESIFDSKDFAEYLLGRLKKRPDAGGYEIQTRDEARAHLAELEADAIDGVYKK